MLLTITLFAGAYVAGSVNFSILLFRFLGKGDPREKFSGNPGATNVYRQAGPVWAAAVMFLDVGRAVGVAVAATQLAAPSWVTWIGLVLIIGNRYPCFHGFRGGKGVANYLGFTLALAPAAALLSVAAWGAMFLVFRTPFLSSFAMIAVLAAGTCALHGQAGFALCGGAVATAGFIVWNHRSNLSEWRARTSV